MRAPKDERIDLLAHYAGAPVRSFAQIDGWLPSQCDGVVLRGRDGYGMTGVKVRELRHTAIPVRVQIHPCCSREHAAALLRKALSWVEESQEWPMFTLDRNPLVEGISAPHDPDSGLEAKPWKALKAAARKVKDGHAADVSWLSRYES